MNKKKTLILLGLLCLFLSMPNISNAENIDTKLCNIIIYNYSNIGFCYLEENREEYRYYPCHEIPLFGIPNAYLVVKFFNKTEYFGKPVKDSETPYDVWLIRYNSDGMISMCENNGKNSRMDFSYDNDGLLSRLTTYDKPTGKEISKTRLETWRLTGLFYNYKKFYIRDYIGYCEDAYVHEYGYRANVLIYKKGTNYYEVLAGSSYSNTCDPLYKLSIHKDDLRERYGLFWKSKVPKDRCKVGDVLQKMGAWDYALKKTKSYSAKLGIPGPEINPYELSQIIRDKCIIEYSWTH